MSDTAERAWGVVEDLKERARRGEDVAAARARMIAMIDAELQRRWVAEAQAVRARRRARQRGWR